jgi:CRP/FNR family cyclic AMP-dependent transcriptional regulator
MKVFPEIHLPSSIEEEIEKYGRIFNFEKGESILNPEELLECFFFVFNGRIKVSQVDPKNGKEQILKILTVGDMYDVVTLLDGKLHENLLTSLDDTTQIMRFPIKVVRSWTRKSPAFNKFFFPYIANQIRETEELALDLSLLSTSQRLLKLMIKNIDPDAPSRLSLIHDLPHEEIAAIIGTVRKVFNRHIQELKTEGVIEVKRKNITLKNPEKLKDS